MDPWGYVVWGTGQGFGPLVVSNVGLHEYLELRAWGSVFSAIEFKVSVVYDWLPVRTNNALGLNCIYFRLDLDLSGTCSQYSFSLQC